MTGTNNMSKYAGCFMCDNLIDHPGEIGLLHLDFPRCFILIKDLGGFWLSDFDNFLKLAKVNWLDPNDRGTSREREDVLIKLYNFSVEVEHTEDALDYADL